MCGLALIRIMAKMSEKESMHHALFIIYIYSDRLMARWRQEIGVRIKKFNQFGEREKERCLLQNRASVVQTSLNSGISTSQTNQASSGILLEISGVDLVGNVRLHTSTSN